MYLSKPMPEMIRGPNTLVTEAPTLTASDMAIHNQVLGSRNASMTWGHLYWLDPVPVLLALTRSTALSLSSGERNRACSISESSRNQMRIGVRTVRQPATMKINCQLWSPLGLA